MRLAHVVLRPVIALLHQPLPVRMAVQSKAWTVFAGIVGSNPTEGMNVCDYSVFVVGSGLATSWSLIQRDLSTILGLTNWSKTKRFTDALCLKWGQQE
jgi:hypothetical protein